MHSIILALSCLIGSMAWAETPEILTQDTATIAPQVALTVTAEIPTQGPSKATQILQSARAISWNFIKDWKVSTLLAAEMVGQMLRVRDHLNLKREYNINISFTVKEHIASVLVAVLTAGYAHWEKTQLDALKAGKVSPKDIWYSKLGAGALALMLFVKVKLTQPGCKVIKTQGDEITVYFLREHIYLNLLTLLIAVDRLEQLRTLSWWFSEKKEPVYLK